MFVFYWFVYFFLHANNYTVSELLQKALALLVLMSSFFVVNFVVKRNKITGTNSFSLLFYVLLMLVFPETLMDNNAVFCSFFLLMASRRLISMRSLKNLKLKIFDATLWVMVSSLFYEWAVLYLFLIFVAIYIYEPKNIRNWLVPLTGIVTALMIFYGVSILAGQDGYLISHYKFHFQFNTDYFIDWGSGTRVVVYLAVTLVAGILAFLKLGSAGLGKVATMRLIALFFIIGLAVKVLTTSSASNAILITFFPAAVFMTNYVESIRKAKIKEIVLVACISITFFVVVIETAIK